MSQPKTYEVKAEKMIKKPVAEVFQALAEGRLFMNCGADSASMKIDFKVGGQYHIRFLSYDISNRGEFLEIIPDKKIAFTWCTSHEEPLVPDTKVTIELFPDGNHTRLTLLHTGFKDAANRDNHDGGWNAGLTDLTTEMTEGKLRLVRVYAASITQLFETCQKKLVKGKVLESVPGKKISFTIDSTSVILTFDEEDEGGSSVELVHTQLSTSALIQTYRTHWQKLTEELVTTLGRNHSLFSDETNS